MINVGEKNIQFEILIIFNLFYILIILIILYFMDIEDNMDEDLDVLLKNYIDASETNGILT
jgi:hypothetical protein